MTGRGSRWRRLLVSAGALALCAACGDDPVRFSHLEFTDLSLAQDVADFDSRNITLSEGTAVSARVIALDSERRRMVPLELDPQDRSVLRVDPTPDPDVLIFVGASVGTTVVDIVVDGRIRGEVAAEVVSQSAP